MNNYLFSLILFLKRRWHLNFQFYLRTFWVLGSVASIIACNNSNFAPYETLGDLRVLSIVTTDGANAEASPGDTVTLTPYVSDITDVGTVTLSASSCVDPGIDYGAPITCAGDPAAVHPSVSNWTSPLTDFLPPITVTIPTTILEQTPPNLQFNGINYLVLLTMTSPTGKVLTTLKRIVVSASVKPGKVQNPAIAAVTNNGAALGFGQISPGSTTNSLSASSTAGSARTYQYIDNAGNLQTTTESLTYTWFVSDGSLQYTRTAEGGVNNFVAPASYPATRDSFVVTVLRNGRGGEAVVKTFIHKN